ncbi:hypothetical protein OSTOST_25906 [Ostertagia ostertagi]
MRVSRCAKRCVLYVLWILLVLLSVIFAQPAQLKRFGGVHNRVKRHHHHHYGWGGPFGMGGYGGFGMGPFGWGR